MVFQVVFKITDGFIGSFSSEGGFVNEEVCLAWYNFTTYTKQVALSWGFEI